MISTLGGGGYYAFTEYGNPANWPGMIINTLFGSASGPLGGLLPCAATKNTGDVCERNCECNNKACGRKTAADGAPLICCPSGKKGTFAAKDYCYGMVDGSRCRSDAMCASGHCRGTGGVGKLGTCGKLDVGQSCGVDSDCKNDHCARESARDGAKKVCCKSGKSGRFGGFDYCYSMPDGTTCWSDAMCASGYCRGNAGGTKKGVCGKLNVGQSCGVDGDCKNGHCARASATDGAKKVCCRSGKSGRYGGFDYCYGMADGTTCWSDAMCATGFCRGSTLVKKGVCGKLGDRASCSKDNECKSGRGCGRLTAADGAKTVCCPSGTKSGRYFGFDYCYGMPKGSVCHTDSMCKSDSCKGNTIGKGVCE